jgi:hypothetical protein
MIEANMLKELTRQIMAQGYDEKTASDYAVLIGDTPCMDEHGNVFVMDGKKQIAKLKPLAFFTAD